MKKQKFKTEIVEWLITVRSFKGKPYYFRFSTKKEALEFAKNGDFGNREIHLYKTVNSHVKSWK